MRKRFALLFTPVVMLLALMLPATTAASSFGSIKITDSWCTGSTAHVAFQVVKNAGHYATRFTLTATGQWSASGKWHNGGSKVFSYTIFNPSARAFFNKTVKYNGGSIFSRIKGTARYYNGNSLVAIANITSGYC